ncbi:hypothetical protein K438DRAFT_1838767 [Mycena galopus ATCC 62051]|nr:hypothetical protein K438DRAFT_1838767 [Mycena galopus ATCC 62051]
MSNLFNGFSATSVFPDHDLCFGDPSNTSTICRIPSATMIRFLNISSPNSYLDAYCNNPPVDSCSFGYCPNPDVASPAVRYSTYFTSLVSALLVLYSPEDVASSFFAQLLNVYSLIVAAIISIAKHNLTKLHSVIALTLAASPLSLYLIMYVFRSLLGRQTRLEAVFGPGKYLNRALVLIILPVWASVLGFTALPTSTWEFQQAACDTEIASNHIASLFFLPFIVFFVSSPEVGALIIASIVIPWGVAIWRLRKIIWAKHDRVLPLGRLWRKVVTRYPFIQFYSVIVLPHTFWIFNVEIGLRALSTRSALPLLRTASRHLRHSPPFHPALHHPPAHPYMVRRPRVGAPPDGPPGQALRRRAPKRRSALPMQQDPAMAGLLTEKLGGLPHEHKPDGLPHEYDAHQMHALDLNKARSAASSRAGSYS